MKAASVFPARRADAARLAPLLNATGTLCPGIPAEDRLTFSYLLSDATYSILDSEHRVIGMFGISPGSFEGTGDVWMVASNAIQKPAIAIRFLKECRRWVEHLHSFYPLLGSIVRADNKVHIKWLTWLGFSLRSGIIISDELFFEFVKLASECAATHTHCCHSVPKVPPKPAPLSRGKIATAFRGPRAVRRFSPRPPASPASPSGSARNKPPCPLAPVANSG
jgi:hypothetical protein